MGMWKDGKVGLDDTWSISQRGVMEVLEADRGGLEKKKVKEGCETGRKSAVAWRWLNLQNFSAGLNLEAQKNLETSHSPGR